MKYFPPILSLALATACAAAPPTPSTKSENRIETTYAPPATESATQPEYPSVLENYEIRNSSLDEVVDNLRNTFGFNILVLRDANASPNYPTVEALKLKNVTAPQILDILTKCYDGLSLEAVGDPTGSTATTVYILKVKDPTSAVIGDARLRNTTTVKIYNLSSFVADGKTKLDDVLSLIQAALIEQGGEQAQVQLHPPTKTLIVRGRESQQLIVQAAVDALSKSADASNAQEVSEMVRTIQSLKAELTAMRAKLAGTATPTTTPANP